AFEYDVPPFALQTLVENAVHHAIATRPEGGSVWITGCVKDGGLQVSVRDDGPGPSPTASPSHQLGLRSVRERLVAALGSAAELHVQHRDDGFEASFVIPNPAGEIETPREVRS